MLGIHTENDLPMDVVTNILPFEVKDTKESARPSKTLAKFGYCTVPSKCTISRRQIVKQMSILFMMPQWQAVSETWLHRMMQGISDEISVVVVNNTWGNAILE